MPGPRCDRQRHLVAAPDSRIPSRRWAVRSRRPAPCDRRAGSGRRTRTTGARPSCRCHRAGSRGGRPADRERRTACRSRGVDRIGRRHRRRRRCVGGADRCRRAADRRARRERGLSAAERDERTATAARALYRSSRRPVMGSPSGAMSRTQRDSTAIAATSGTCTGPCGILTHGSVDSILDRNSDCSGCPGRSRGCCPATVGVRRHSGRCAASVSS